MRGRIGVDTRIAAAFIAAGTGMVLCLAGIALDPRAALGGWMTSALFLLGLPLGAMTVLMIHMLTGGAWGDAMRTPLRAMVATLPLALVLLLPALPALGQAFPWAGADALALPETVRHKLAYLNEPFFLARFVICSAVWLMLAWFVLAWTSGRPARADVARRRRRGSAIGLVVHGLAVTILSIDWMLSLEPEFYSTIYPMLEASGQVVGAGALCLITLAAGHHIESVHGGDEHVTLGEDIANVLYGFVLLWVYLAFMQWLIVWAGDLPVEIRWYLHRVEHGWQVMLWLLITLHFAVPFAAFLNRDVKRSRAGLLALGWVVLAAHLIDVFWRIRPPFSPEGPALHWLDVAAFAGAGGLWAALFLFVLSRPHHIEAWLERQRHA